MKAFNGLGIVVALLLAFILLIPKPKDNSDPGLSDVQHLFYFVIPLPVLMILAYKRILIDPSERQIQITKGIWPVVIRKEIPFEDIVEIQFDAMKGRWISYSAQLALPSQKKPILIFADGDEEQLRTMLDFARISNFKLHTAKGMQTFAPDWVRAALPELNEWH